MAEEKETRRLATASAFGGGMPTFGNNGEFYLPDGSSTLGSSLGITPEKLIVPREYHAVLRMANDFYQRGGIVGTVINRLAEFSITEIRNGQRKTTNEVNSYFEAVLHKFPSQLMRFLRQAALEYYISGMVLPRIDWVRKSGKDISSDLRPNKMYTFPQFDLYPPLTVDVRWLGWGQKTFWLKIPSSDLRLIRANGSRIKAQQAKLTMWQQFYPSYVEQIVSGANEIQLTEVSPILRKETSISPYPTPYLYPALEPLIFKQQLRRMDFAVAARVINAILLVQEGDKDFPLVAMGDTDNPEKNNLDVLRQQIEMRSGNPILQERLFMLFSNHTTRLTWITPDVDAMLNQDKYRQINEDLQESLGFTQVLITGESKQAQASEVSTWAIQPQMEELRSMLIEWLESLYIKCAELNSFPIKTLPAPKFRPIKLQDFTKTAATFAQAFKEGNISRTTRAESVGVDLETEVELMKDEQTLLKGLPAYTPTPYSPPPPMVGSNTGGGRPPGSQNVPINNRNSGVKPQGQQPLSKIAAEIDLMDDEDVVDLINSVAEQRGILVIADTIINNS